MPSVFYSAQCFQLHVCCNTLLIFLVVQISVVWIYDISSGAEKLRAVSNF